MLSGSCFTHGVISICIGSGALNQRRPRIGVTKIIARIINDAKPRKECDNEKGKIVGTTSKTSASHIHLQWLPIYRIAKNRSSMYQAFLTLSENPGSLLPTPRIHPTSPTPHFQYIV